MNVVFMGTPDFAVPSLRLLAAHHDVSAVYTRPDAVSRRGNALVAPPVKVVATKLGIPVYQPGSLRDAVEVERLVELAPDVICVAAYGMILPKDVLSIPRFGCINVHASLLPRHRGAAPVHRAVLDGDELLGVSIMRMEEGLDTGPYAMQRSLQGGHMSVEQLTDLLAEQGAEALLEVLEQVAGGSVEWVAQDDSASTYAPKISRDDVALHPDLSVEDALRRVRASTRQAPSRLLIGEVMVTVVHASDSQKSLNRGEVNASPDGLLIGLADGALRLDRIRPAGKSDMDGGAWVCGARLPQPCKWKATS